MEVIAIIVEKGLLGLVALALGAYFAHRLEKYKATNAYFQALSNQKLKAYEEVAELLGRQLFRTQAFLHAVAAGMPRTGNEDTATSLVAEYNALRRSYSDEAPQFLACSLYFTEELGTCITAYLNAFHGVFSSFADGPDSMNELTQELRRLMDSSTEVQLKLRQEVNSNPFQ